MTAGGKGGSGQRGALGGREAGPCSVGGAGLAGGGGGGAATALASQAHGSPSSSCRELQSVPPWGSPAFCLGGEVTHAGGHSLGCIRKARESGSLLVSGSKETETCWKFGTLILAWLCPLLPSALGLLACCWPGSCSGLPGVGTPRAAVSRCCRAESGPVQRLRALCPLIRSGLLTVARLFLRKLTSSWHISVKIIN